jgi:hypothetical protein
MQFAQNLSFVLRHPQNNENMVRKGMLLVTDVASKSSGWIRAFEGERTYTPATTNNAQRTTRNDN